MMHSITNDRAKTDNGTKYTGIRILAVFFWIAIWQFASMYLKQEILLASPVSVIMKYQGQKAESRSCLHDKTFELGTRQT